MNYSCLKCDQHIYDNVDSVCCCKCDKWIHKTCANISDKKYKDMQENKPGDNQILTIFKHMTLYVNTEKTSAK